MEKNTDISERILFVIENQAIKPNLFAKKLGYERSQTIYDILNCKSAPSFDFFKRFVDSEYSEIFNIEWLISGKGKPFKIVPAKMSPHSVPSKEKDVPPIVSNTSKWNDEFSAMDTSQTLKEIAVKYIPINMLKSRAEAYKPIPFVGEAAVAGFGNAAFALETKDVKDYYVVPKFKDRRIDFMIEIHGMSMVPTFYPGDVVACTIIRESCFIQWNRVYLIATEEQGILIKRLKKSTNETAIKLVSDNPDYDPFDVELTDIKGLALVQGIIRLE